jgi:hypothetical protein
MALYTHFSGFLKLYWATTNWAKVALAYPKMILNVEFLLFTHFKEGFVLFE